MHCVKVRWLRHAPAILAAAAWAITVATAGGAHAQAPAPAMDVSFIPPSAVAAVVVRPQQMLSSPQMQLMPLEVFSALGKQQAGIDPLDIEQAVIVVDKVQNPQNPPEFGVILRLSKPYQAAQILPQMFAGAQTVAAGGKSYLKGAHGPANALHLANERTAIVATEPMMRQMLAAAPTGPLATLLQKTNVEHHVTAIASIDAMRAEVNAMVAQAQQQPLPPPFKQFLAVPQHLSAVALRTSLTDKVKLELILLAPSEASAQELERLTKNAVAMGREAAINMAVQQAQASDDPNDPVQQAMLRYTQRMADYYAQMLQPKRTGRAVMIAAENDSGTATMSLAVAMLLPAIQAARGAAQSAQSSNNLKQIGLAIHNYHDVYGSFPTDITDDQGNALLSWRVQLLPYVEEQRLYDRFRRNEPWNSPHNLQLLAEMPDVFQNPLVTDPTATVYLAPRGQGTLWEDGKKKLSFRDVPDGTSNTIMAVEANAEKAVPWTKPDDLTINPANPLAGLGDLRPNGFSVLMADGSVRTLTKMIAPNVLRALFTRAGGEAVPLP